MVVMVLPWCCVFLRYPTLDTKSRLSVVFIILGAGVYAVDEVAGHLIVVKN